MKFQIEKDSPVPVQPHIKERNKTALYSGELRLGDVLFSIRDLESELGVSQESPRDGGGSVDLTPSLGFERGIVRPVLRHP